MVSRNETSEHGIICTECQQDEYTSTDENKSTKAEVLPVEQDYSGSRLADILAKESRYWWRRPEIIKLNFLLLTGILSGFTKGFDSTTISGLQSTPEWERQFGHPHGVRLGLITNGVQFGQFGALCISAWLCHQFGRRRPIAIGSISALIGTALQCGARKVPLFVIGRVFTGFGYTVCKITSPMLISEVCFPSQRTQLTGLSHSTESLGQAIAAWITYGSAFLGTNSWSWRTPVLLQCVTSFIQLTLSFFVPESARWLVYRGESDKAFEILTKYHGGGDPNSELVKLEMAEIESAITEDNIQNSSSWLDWFRTRANIRRFAIVLAMGLMMQLEGHSLVSHYMSPVLKSIGITDYRTQLTINACSQLNTFVWAVSCSFLIERAGRRRLFLIGFSGMVTSYVIWTILASSGSRNNFANHHISDGVVAMIFILDGFHELPAVVQPNYVADVAPYTLRGKAFVLDGFGDFCASIFNGFVNPIALEVIGWRYFIVWCVVLSTSLTTIYLFFPETKGHSLEEVSSIFDRREYFVCRRPKINRWLSRLP